MNILRQPGFDMVGTAVGSHGDRRSCATLAVYVIASIYGGRHRRPPHFTLQGVGKSCPIQRKTIIQIF